MFGKIVISFLSFLLVLLAVILVIDVRGYKNSHQPSSSERLKYVDAICEPTTYKEICATSLEPVAENSSATFSDYIKAVVETTLDEMKKSLEVTEKTNVNNDTDHYNYMALEDCKNLLDKAIDTLHKSLHVFNVNMENIAGEAHHLLSWMAGTYSLQINCIDQIENPELKSAMNNILVNSTKVAHNVVHIFSQISDILKLFNVHSTVNNQHISESDGYIYPNWFGADEHRLLSEAFSEPNIVVAKDGSGNFKTIGDAIASYPSNHQGRFIIHVKAGVYEEQVLVNKDQQNIYIYGDGIGRTIVTGKKNSKKMKIPTDATSTFSTQGDGFIARAMTFKNEAGPEGDQAVAFRSMAERTAVFNCSFEGFQDTLFYQAYKQFYRNCYIYGTIDFIFGMGTAVIQDSTIVVRRPVPGQSNIVSADGRCLKNTTTGGLVLQNCKIIPDEYLYNERFHFPTYLSRPWKDAALTVVMQSELSDFIRPEGYTIWKGQDNHKTCEMYEFDNRGPGAKTDNRSKDFKHFKVLKPEEAALFTPGTFLIGHDWIPQTGIPYKLGL